MPYRELLEEAYWSLRTRFSIGEPLGPTQLLDSSLKALCRYRHPVGESCLELHDDGSGPRLWIAVPKVTADEDATGLGRTVVHLWYEFVHTGGAWSSVRHEGLLCPPYPPPQFQLPPLEKTWDWSGGGTYDWVSVAFRGTDPPHWSPILMGDTADDIGRIHQLMQDPATRHEAIALLDAARPGDADLTDRVMNAWPPVTLRGIVTSSDFAQSDFAVDHTTGYHDGHDAPHGDITQGSVGREPSAGWGEGILWASGPGIDPETYYWEGLDYDLQVIPDPDLSYLGAWNRYNKQLKLNVEIEHFALPKPYRPAVGDWVQVTGRWVIDAGHGGRAINLYRSNATLGELSYRHEIERHFGPGFDPEDALSFQAGRDTVWFPEFFTEIHPPELLVSTQAGESSTMVSYRVIATGAWLGGTLDFVIYPPPRPSIDAELTFEIVRADGVSGYDRIDNCRLEVVPQPPQRPNHLVCRIESTSDDFLLLFNSGMVGMTPNRGLQCMIRCGWHVPSAFVDGQVMFSAGRRAAAGSRVFYRRQSTANARWRVVDPHDDGSFRVESLDAYNTYTFRPAGSGWDFREVPRDVVLSPSRNHLTTFEAAPHISALSRWAPPSRDLDYPEAVHALLVDLLVTTRLESDVLGVYRNGLSMPEFATASLRLLGLNDPSGRPISEPSRAFLANRYTRSHDLPPVIIGTLGEGVEHARVRVQLVTGNVDSGYVVADELETSTDALGIAEVVLDTGSHCEDLFVSFEILENPHNPWFNPMAPTNPALAHPATSGDDYTYLVPYRLRHATFAGGRLRHARLLANYTLLDSLDTLTHGLGRDVSAGAVRGDTPDEAPGGADTSLNLQLSRSSRLGLSEAGSWIARLASALPDDLVAKLSRFPLSETLIAELAGVRASDVKFLERADKRRKGQLRPQELEELSKLAARWKPRAPRIARAGALRQKS